MSLNEFRKQWQTSIIITLLIGGIIVGLVFVNCRNQKMAKKEKNLIYVLIELDTTLSSFSPDIDLAFFSLDKLKSYCNAETEGLIWDDDDDFEDWEEEHDGNYGNWCGGAFIRKTGENWYCYQVVRLGED